jgi:aerobic C4-dicarboxylate transport protein
LHRFGPGALVFDADRENLACAVLHRRLHHEGCARPVRLNMALHHWQYGVGSLFSLGKLMGAFYGLLFIFVVLGTIAKVGFSIWKFIKLHQGY